MVSGPGSSPPGAHEASERNARERSVGAMLRQLWLGLATYRLYPENPERPGFAPAVERVGAAVAEALGAGRVDLEIRGDQFLLEGVPLSRDVNVERLALACFERRVERLIVLAVPKAFELERLFAALSQPPEELEGAGGAEAVLREGEVVSVALSAVGPGAVEEAEHALADAAPTAASGAPAADLLASGLMVEDLHGTPGDQAETLLSRLRQLIADGGLGGGPPIDVHAAVHDMITGLPEDLRRSFIETLVDRAHDDPLAGRVIGTMSNAELSRALIDLGGSGRRDPLELARGLAAAGVRQVDIVDLTRALESGHEDLGTIVAGLERIGVDLGDMGGAPDGGSVLEVLSEYLSATERDDLRTIREAVESGETMRAAQILAAADYLVLESDLERAADALDVWADELRQAFLGRDEREVASLLQTLRESLLGHGEERAALFAACIRRVLAPEVVQEVVTAEAGGDHTSLATLLAPFGDDGVETLVDLLGQEEDRNRRALLVGALRQITPEHPTPVVARLSDPRWYVVRNAVVLLGAGRNSTVLRPLAEAASHPSIEVRREVPEAIAAAGGVEAVPYLVRLALVEEPDVPPRAVGALGTLFGEEAAAGLAEVVRSSSDRAIRLQALGELAERPKGGSLLGQLASSRGETRLPWRLRRQARRLLARSERGAR